MHGVQDNPDRPDRQMARQFRLADERWSMGVGWCERKHLLQEKIRHLGIYSALHRDPGGVTWERREASVKDKQITVVHF